MIAPDMAIGLGPQVQELLRKDTLYTTALQKLESIDIKSYAPSASGQGQQTDGQSEPEEGQVIVLPVKGTMLKYGTLCTYGTDEIAHYVKHFAAKKEVAGIVLDIDSGGGAVSAVPPLLEAIQFTQENNKPIVAHCDTSCSAAYWTASATDQIFANNTISSVFGSIGVMLSYLDMVPYYEKQGAKYHEVYAENSSDKNSAFQKLIKGDYEQIITEDLNPLAEQFQEAVKANRDGKLKIDHKGILTGATFPANTAKEIGLIDQMGTLTQAINYVHANAWASL